MPLVSGRLSSACHADIDRRQSIPRRPKNRQGEALAITVLSLFEAHLAVGDLDASVAFYRDVLELHLAHVTTAKHAAFFWIGARGNAMLGLWTAGAAPQKTTLHLAFAASLEDVIAAP